MKKTNRRHLPARPHRKSRTFITIKRRAQRTPLGVVPKDTEAPKLVSGTKKKVTCTASAAERAPSKRRSADRSHSILPDWSNRADILAVSIDKITIDTNVSPRSQLNDEVVEKLEKALASGSVLPPMIAFQTEDGIILADGHHRFRAHQQYGSTEVEVEVRYGSAREAGHYALYVNTRHGAKLSRKEVRTAIRKLLGDRETHMWSDAEIAKLCHCSPPTVAKVRKSHPLTPELSSEGARYVRRGQQRVLMETGNIGGKSKSKSKSKEAAPAQPDDSEGQTEDPAAAADIKAGSTGGSSSKKRAADKAALFLDRVEALLKEWESSKVLAQALRAKKGDSNLLERFEKNLRRLIRVRDLMDRNVGDDEVGSSKKTKKSKKATSR